MSAVVSTRGRKRGVLNLNIGSWKGELARNKPLLLLRVLRSLRAGMDNRSEWLLWKDTLQQDIRRFANPRSSPHLAFWHLATDGVWTLEGKRRMKPGKSGHRPNKSEFDRVNPVGRLDGQVWRELEEDSALRAAIEFYLRKKYFSDVEKEIEEYFAL